MTSDRMSFLWIFTGMLLSAVPLSASGADRQKDFSEPDTLTRILEEVTVQAGVDRQLESGATRIDVSDLNTRARILGESDILQTLKIMPGTMTVGDYGSGIMVDGAEASQTLFQIDGAPVFFPYRFGGVFSAFNSAFFRLADFEPISHNASSSSRLGAIVNLYPYYRSNGLKGEINVGLLSSSLALRYGKGNKWCISAAGRVSYLNQLYGSLLKKQESSIEYDFSDLNIGGASKISDRDILSFGVFRSHDVLQTAIDKYGMDTDISWINTVASVAWRHSSQGSQPSVDITTYYSDFRSSLFIEMQEFKGYSFSGIKDMGVIAKLWQSLGKEDNFRLDYGAEGNYYICEPQWSELHGYGDLTGNSRNLQNFGNVRCYANITSKTLENIDIEGGLSAEYYICGRYRNLFLDPRINVRWYNRLGKFNFHFGIYHQYLHQTGLSEIGLASDFWSGATTTTPVEKSYTFMTGWYHKFTDIVDIEADVYFRHIKNSPEYEGGLLDIVGNDFNAIDHIVMSRGISYGINMKLSRTLGKVTGSLGYSYGDGQRRTGNGKYWRSRTSIGNVLRLSATYIPETHWRIGATFHFASGRPYTPIKSIYLVTGNIMMEYGEHNSRRLPSYQRLDLSASYIFKSGGRLPMRHIINLSLLNAYGHKNVEMQFYIISSTNGSLRKKGMVSLYRFLPSISYTVEL